VRSIRSFASLDSANKVRTTLFSPTADSGTQGFQGTARDSRERNSTPTPMLGVQQPVAQLLTSRQSSVNKATFSNQTAANTISQLLATMT
jgi:hypothetical protein